MPASDSDQEKARREQELRIQRQIAFASGIFQGDVTVHTLLESLAEGAVIIDSSGTILLVNTRAEQMFDYPKKELIGKSHAVLIPERFRKVHEEHQAHFFAEPRIRPMGQLLDLAGLRRDGSEFPLEISLSFIETINGILIMAFISDITLRKQYESHLRESEELFHIQVEGVKDYAIFMLDAQGNVLNWNVGAERLKGYRAEEINGKHFSCFYPEEDRAGGKPTDKLKIAAAEGRAEDQGWLIRKDGSRFWADVIITALRDESGNLRGFSIVTRDITERKKVEDALRFSEERFRALYRDNPTMIFTLDADLTIISANPFSANQLGYTIDELEGQSVLKVFHEDDRSVMAEQLRECLQNPDQVFRWQFRKVRKDGGLLWVEEIAQTVYDLNGALSILIVCQDITERKRTEEALLESEEKFSKIFDTAPVGITISTLADGRFVEINREGERLSGYRRDEVIGRTALEFWKDPVERDRMIEEVRKEGAVRDREMTFRDKEGNVLWGLFSAVVIDIGGKKHLLSLVSDITDRQRAEEALRESEDKFSKAFQTAPALLSISSLADGRYVEVNEAFEKIMGYRRDEVIGHAALQLGIWENPADRDRLVRQLRAGSRVRDFETRFRGKAGKVIDGSLSAEIINVKGEECLLALTRDITGIKQAEENLRRSEQQLTEAQRLARIGSWEWVVGADKFTASAELYRIFGVAPEELDTTYAGILNMVHPDDREQYEKDIQEAIAEKKSFENYHRIIRTDGTFRILHSQGTVTVDENDTPVSLLGTCQDVTERKRAEEALRESENKFSKAFQATPSVLVIASLEDGRYMEVNEAFERVMGYRRDEVLGRSSLELNIWQNPEDRAIVLRMLAEGKKVRDLEVDFKSKSGTILVGIYSAEIIEIGAEQCLLSLVNDITARKKAEEELRHSEERYRRLYNDTPVMLHSIDHDGRLVSVSNYWLETLGYERGEVLGRRTTEFLTSASRSYATEIVLPEFYRTGSCKEVPYQIVKKNGEILDILLSAIAERDSEGKVVRSLAVMVDVTERNQVEEALRKSEDKFSKIFHSVPVLIGISTLAEGRFIDVNETCMRILGYQREEMIGRTSLELGIWESQADRDKAIRALEEQGTVRDLEVNLRGKTGETVSALFSAELIDFDGERYMISLVNDITARKHAEEEIERLNTDLAARAAELEGANRELEAFNYTVAHDLRKPLTVINSYTQVIKELCGNKLDEKCIGYLEEAYKGTLRMNELIDALLNFSRLAHVKPRRERVDLSAMAHEVAAELQLNEPERRVTFRVADGISANGDANLLRVVLDNLLGNAWKYTAAKDEAVIELGMTKVDGQPAYFVRDNGAGFAMADAEKIFIPFQRLSGSEKFKGFGIGLTTVERIIRRHGGRIWAEGEPDKGATFYFTLSGDRTI